jgi:gluconolactonase
MADGAALVVEVLGPRLTRVLADGVTETVAETPGGPDGAAVGPDGANYVCATTVVGSTSWKSAEYE